MPLFSFNIVRLLENQCGTSMKECTSSKEKEERNKDEASKDMTKAQTERNYLVNNSERQYSLLIRLLITDFAAPFACDDMFAV